MSATTMGQVHENDWETIYDRRVALLQEAACSGDLALLAAIRVQDKLEYGDFSKAMDSADEETKQTYREMETRFQEENKKSNAETDEVKAKMEKLKNNDKGQEDWEKMLDEAINKGKKDSIERWDKLNKFGKTRSESWFGGAFAADDLLNRAHQALNNSQGLSELAKGAAGVSGLGDVAAKVQNMSLDNVTLVKRGSGWVMELPI
ncbi:unnamed protein product [Penicillium viridicatum]